MRCGGVLVPPDGQGSETPRDRWVRRCLIAEQPERTWTTVQLALTVDHWFPQSQHAAWGLSPEDRSKVHPAHKFCQDSQGGRIKTREQWGSAGRAALATRTPEQRSQRGHALKSARTRTSEQQSKSGLSGAHKFWHVGRGKVNPECELCAL